MIRAHKEGKLKIVGSGRNIVDVTSVSNVVDAILLSLNAPSEALGKAYNITNGDPIYLRKFIEKAFERLHLKMDRSRVPFAVAYAAAALLEKQAALKPDYPEPPVTCYGIGILAKSMKSQFESFFLNFSTASLQLWKSGCTANDASVCCSLQSLLTASVCHPL